LSVISYVTDGAELWKTQGSFKVQGSKPCGHLKFKVQSPAGIQGSRFKALRAFKVQGSKPCGHSRFKVQSPAGVQGSRFKALRAFKVQG
jgi:hypothetical protein